MNSKMIAVATLVAGSTVATGQALPWRSFDAALDAAGDTTWSNTGTLQGGQGNNFNFATNATAVDVNDAIAVGLTKAYDISQTGAIAGVNWSFWGQAGGGRTNHAETSYEVFFNATDLSGQHVIMEIGGALAGVSLALDNNSLIWASNTGGSSDPTHSIATTIGTGWQHAVATWNRNTLTTSLYLNGQLIGSTALAAGTTGWTGGNEAGLGGVTSTSVVTTFDSALLTDFDGQIAAFNYYREEISAQQILDTYNSVFIPAPGAAAVFGLGLAGLAGRRRR